ncbi:homeobox BEL1 homolog [Olea europaea subsp. europaea]|uniref:Homeobox BEL1 homolog n=1 Tax=Olea europaea subsp. europaea TaxID=158383 RepID=A0A8S0UL97_OLEEU|nr:homeobox BEL1 homolog [Olea europaea subsp. europaea]
MDEIHHLTAGMGMIGFPGQAGNHHHQGGASSSKVAIGELTTNKFYQHGHDLTNDTLIVSPDWNLDHDPSTRCVFPCEGNERPSQGLSLSLSSSNPCTIGLQSCELRQQEGLRFSPSSSRDGFFDLQNQGHILIRNSKYLNPAQELLNEFCNPGTKITDHDHKSKLKINHSASDQRQDENVIKKQSLHFMDLLELQKRKTKLIQMIEEVDKRYKHYCHQMKGVISSFEEVAGAEAAAMYSALASKAMSRHFRCLRDGIINQIKATKKEMEDKSAADAPGTNRGDTPSLRILDQTLRKRKAIRQMNLMESHAWRPQRGLPERSVSVLRAWLFEHFLNPYPSDVDKHILAHQTGLSRSQESLFLPIINY